MQTDRINPTSHSYFSQRLRLHYLDWGNGGARHLTAQRSYQNEYRTWQPVSTKW